jgi:hypothetical protein
VYESWKEFTSAVHRGYTNYGFEAWTIPCLYVAGKYLQLFAIKSDEERNATAQETNGMEFRDDFDPETEKHQQLRDCEQQLKRIFTLCLSDRYVFLMIPCLLLPHLTLRQSTPRRLKEMGHILCHQPVIQDIF